VKLKPRRFLPWVASGVLALACAAAPVFAAEEGSPDPVNTPVGVAFHWFNFLLVAGALTYLVRKFMAPQFHSAAESISKAIHEAGDTRAAAERELQVAEQSLAGLHNEVQSMRGEATRESVAEAERLRKLTTTETEKIARAAQAEIHAAERAGLQELRSIAALLGTQRAAEILRARMTPGTESALFESFVAELERTPQ